jgi:hypothetical protein
MRDGKWRTLARIAFEAKAPEASVSALIRDLANEKGIPRDKRHAKDSRLFEYRLLADGGTRSDEREWNADNPGTSSFHFRLLG